MRRVGPDSTSDQDTRPPRATVLVVDDNDMNRRVARIVLEEAYDVLEARDAASAIAQLSSHTIDIVLLDVMMPGTSGLDVCRQIKARQCDGFLPVVLLTALSDSRDRIAGLEAGADDFLTKPIDRHELMLRVRAFVRIREQDTIIRRQVEAQRALDALKDDLVSLVVHDLRNPLAGLLGMLHVIRDAVAHGDLDIAPDIDLALTAAQRIQGALDDLLQVRKLEEGRLVVQLGTCSAHAVADDAIASVIGDARARGVGLRRMPDSDDAALDIDRTLVRRALENLLANAIARTPRGAEVELRARVDRDVVVFDVADRGSGVPPAVRPHLFEKFGAVSVREQGVRHGYGLGLYLVRLVATAHGGHVCAVDRPGGGALFQLALPRARRP